MRNMSATAQWGERIRGRREALGLTVEELAAALQRHPATVYRWENSETAPHLRTMEEIAGVLETTVSDLFFSEAAS